MGEYLFMPRSFFFRTRSHDRCVDCRVSHSAARAPFPASRVDAMRATAASFLCGGVSVAAAPCRRHHGSPPRRLANPVFARNAHRTITAASAETKSSALSAPTPKRSVLFVSFLWPEASSSAAGVRTHSLLRAFADWGWQVHFLACAKPNAHTASLQQSEVTVHCVLPNRGGDFEQALHESNADCVVFDRFTAEEAFSYRVKAARPNAARILDMQDLHSLRYARQAAVKECLAGQKTENETLFQTSNSTRAVRASLAAVPVAGDPYLSRELASVLRSDLTLVCSPVELRMMRETFGVPISKLALASFFCDEGELQKNSDTGNSFRQRSGFTTIGTFYHPPNVDGVRWLRFEVWPLIRSELPDATMRVYGSYPTEAVKQLHSKTEGFHVLGFAESIESAMADARVLLAPLRFGAGIKGKIVDAWMHGVPVVTTPIGAEGMVPGVDKLWTESEDDSDSDTEKKSDPEKEKSENETWGGSWRSLDAAGFARDAVALHEDSAAWEATRRRGRELVKILFPHEKNLDTVRREMEGLFETDGDLPLERARSSQALKKGLVKPRTVLEKRRAEDFVGQTLWHHSLRSTEYFSRWIEVKETGGDSGVQAEPRDVEEIR